MSTYVVSDIHGALTRLKDLMSQVNFSDEDDLYILGDIIDRGPQSAEALVWVIEEAPHNIHFLMGNHEDMMYSVLKYHSDIDMQNKDQWFQVLYNEPWSWNGGKDTLQQLIEMTTPQWRQDVLIPWLEDLPFFFDVVLGEERYIMVHAGLIETTRFGDDFNSRGICKWINIPEYGECFSQNLLWTRERWYLNNVDFPYNVIFGHTPTHYWVNLVRQYQKFDWYSKDVKIEGEEDEIVILTMENGKKRIGVDTGYNWLGMIRLEDMRTFYSEI